MKNKHLVLLFLATVVVGWLFRRAPWQAKQWFQTELIQVDTARLSQLRILLPGQPELLLERTDAGWAAQQEGRSVVVAVTDMAPILQTLAAVRSIRIMKTQAPDTLGLSAAASIQVTAYQENDITEDFRIGRTIIENQRPATFIRLSAHEGNYLVENDLHQVFAHTLEDFRSSRICEFLPAQVRRLRVEWPVQRWTLALQRDSTGRQWQDIETDSLRSDSMIQNWLRSLTGLPRCPYADYFDDSRARETLQALITLDFDDQQPPLILRLFQIDPADLPENLSELYRQKVHPAPFVLHSSQNPNNYFALADTVVARQISYGLDSTALLLPVISRSAH